jgi:cobaltochelatase CobT
MSTMNAVRAVQRFGGLDPIRTLVLVAAAFGRKTGVKIAIGGDSAYTDGDVITIPAVAEDNPRVMELIWGYLAHEAGHVRFTDFEAVVQMAEEGNAFLMAVWNILEDVRIENAMIRVYPGTRSTMDETVESLLAVDDDAVSETDAPATVLADGLLVMARHQYRKQEFLRPQAEQTLRVLRKVFPNTFVLRLMGLMCDISALGSTQDTIELARRIVALIEEEAKPQQPQDTGEETPEEAADGDPSDGDGGGNGDNEAEAEAGDSQTPGDSPDSPVEEGAEESVQDSGGARSGGDGSNAGESADSADSQGDTADTEAESGDGAGESAGEGEGQGAEFSDRSSSGDGNGDDGDSASLSEGDDPASDADKSVPHRQGSDGGTDDDGGGHGDGAGGQSALQAVLGAKESDLPEDLFAAAARELEQRVQRDTYGRSPNLFPAAVPFEGDQRLGGELVNRVTGESRRLMAQLHGIVQAETMTRHRTVRRGRRLSAPHLHRAAVGDDRIFSRKDERRAPNTAIHLLVDMSGSMAEPKCTLAMEAALALGLALESIPGVSLAATAFPDVEGDDNAVTVMLRRGQVVRSAAGAFVQQPRGGTPLTEAAWFAAAELLAAEEPRKVLIVLTDGDPNDRSSASDIIQRMSMAGVEVIGIGIFHDASWLFPTHLMIRDLAQLKPELMRIARQLLIA